MKKEKPNTVIKKSGKNETGITLIALVITIIVLLILAGVSISMLTGQNGILTQANNSKIEQSHGAVREGIALAYNEYQIEIKTANNTKLASTEVVQIQGKEEKALASYSSFLDFLEQKGYVTIDEENPTTGIINVEKLTGGKQALGNGTDTDVYKIMEQDGSYVVNYYDQNGMEETILKLTKDNNKVKEVTIEDTIGSAGGDVIIQYEEGMTWGEWLSSEYNGGEFIVNGNRPLYKNMFVVVYSEDLLEVQADEEIQSNGKYTFLDVG